MFKRTFRSLSPFVGASTVLPSPQIPFTLHLIPSLSAEAEIRRTRHSLPSVMIRAGTSKGLFIHRHHMPSDQAKWGKVLLAVMGSRDGDQKQIDGVGGATSTTSKVAIISKSTRPDADVDYTFAQVVVGQEKVDFTGNCGNIASGVGPFALDEGLVRPVPGQTELDVRIFNVNTGRLLVETVKVGPDGRFEEAGGYRIGGVIGTGSEIKVAFINPAGSMTGKLFPTGNKKDFIEVSSMPELQPFTVSASLVDAANPFIFVDRASLPQIYHQLGPSAPKSLEIIEAIRCAGSVKCRLTKDVTSASLIHGTPKIAVLSPPRSYKGEPTVPDIEVTAFSMGKVHSTLQLTGAVCLGAAVCIEETIAHHLSTSASPTPPGTRASDPTRDLREESSEEKQVIIRHGDGLIKVGVRLAKDGSDEVRVEKVTVSRTARRLFEGNVFFSL